MFVLQPVFLANGRLCGAGLLHTSMVVTEMVWQLVVANFIVVHALHHQVSEHISRGVTVEKCLWCKVAEQVVFCPEVLCVEECPVQNLSAHLAGMVSTLRKHFFEETVVVTHPAEVVSSLFVVCCHDQVLCIPGMSFACCDAEVVCVMR